jgi:steroid delta-isomerase-like uncharacterized protein
MNNQEQQKIVRTLFEEVFTAGNLNVCDQFFDENLQFFDPSAPNFRGGLQGFKERELGYQKAFPNKKCHIDELLFADDKVIVRWSVQGTHGGDLPGIPKTGKKIQVSGIMILKFKNEKIIEIRQIWDQLGLLEQLGQVQPQLALV